MREGLIIIQKETMTPKERWQAVLSGKKPDRIPLDYWATQEFNQKLITHLNCSDINEVYDRLHIDIPVTVGPDYVGPAVPENEDIYGCKYESISYGEGVYRECVEHPLADFETVNEVKKEYEWPSLQWYDYSSIPDQIKGKEEHPIRGGGSEPFLVYKNLRGQEQAFLDLKLNPELVHYCLQKLFSFSYENTKRIYEQIPGEVMITYVAEDMGAEKSLMYSPEQIKEFFFPGMKKMIDLAHEEGAFVMHHNDGAISEIIPDLIELGIDVLNPIQWNCKGMDRELLQQKYGDKIVFHGAMDNQYTLAFGSKEEVRQEVIDNINILGENGGYILAPCHNIQTVSPPENIITMYETAYERGWI